MAFIRAKQRVITGLSPHQGNRKYLIPKRPVDVIVGAPQPPDGAKEIDPAPTTIGTGWEKFGSVTENWAFVMPPGDAFNPLRFDQLLPNGAYFYRFYARGNLTTTFRWRATGQPAGDVVLSTEKWYSGSFVVDPTSSGGSAPRLTHTADELGKVEVIDVRFWLEA